jgi:hypothetical protein
MSVSSSYHNHTKPSRIMASSSPLRFSRYTPRECYALYHGDCVLALPDLSDNSVGLSVSSWPFSDRSLCSSYSASVCSKLNSLGGRFTLLKIIPVAIKITIIGNVSNDKIINNGMWITGSFFSGDVISIKTLMNESQSESSSTVPYTISVVPFIVPFSSKCFPEIPV